MGTPKTGSYLLNFHMFSEHMCSLWIAMLGDGVDSPNLQAYLAHHHTDHLYDKYPAFSEHPSGTVQDFPLEDFPIQTVLAVRRVGNLQEKRTR